MFALHDEPEVPRVWLPFDDSPGLAMARAFGDFCLKDYGVIAVHEMSYRQLTERDQFIVLATDGGNLTNSFTLPPHPSHTNTKKSCCMKSSSCQQSSSLGAGLLTDQESRVM